MIMQSSLESFHPFKLANVQQQGQASKNTVSVTTYSKYPHIINGKYPTAFNCHTKVMTIPSFSQLNYRSSPCMDY